MVFTICDPLWEKVPLGANYNFEIRVKIAESGPLVVYCVYYTVENYSLFPTFSCKSGGCPPFLALTASPQRREVRPPRARARAREQLKCTERDY